MEYLKLRIKWARDLDSGPRETYIRAFAEVSDMSQVEEALSEYLEIHNNPGSKQFALHQLARLGKLQEAGGILAELEALISRSRWLSEALRLYCYTNDTDKQLKVVDEILISDFISHADQRLILSIIDKYRGRNHALKQIDQWIKKEPDYLGLYELKVDYFQGSENEYIELLSQCVEQFPNSRKLKHRLYRLHIESGSYEQALTILKMLHHDDPYDFTLQFNLIIAFYCSGQKEEALKAFNAALTFGVVSEGIVIYATDFLLKATEAKDISPRLEELYVSTARDQTLIQSFFHLYQLYMDPKEALGKLTRLIDKAGRNHLWYELNELCLRAVEVGSMDLAVKCGDRLISDYPSLPGSWVAQFKVRRAQQNFPEMENSLKKAIELNPNWSYPRVLLSTCLRNAGKLEESRDLVLESYKANPNDYSILCEKVIVDYKLDNIIEVIATLKLILKQNPDDSWAIDRLIDVAYNFDKEQEILKILEDSHHAHPSSKNIIFALASVYGQKGQVELQKEYLLKIIKQDPGHRNANRELAFSLFSIGKREEAVELINRAYQYSNDPSLKLVRAFLYLKEGEKEKGISEAEHILLEHPNHLETLEMLRSWLGDSKDNAKLLKIDQNLARLMPENGDVWQQLGETHYKLGQIDDAITALNRSLKLDPNNRSTIFRLMRIYLDLKKADCLALLLEKLEDDPSLEFIGRLYFLSLKGDVDALATLLLETMKNKDFEESWLVYIENTLDTLGRGQWLRSIEKVFQQGACALELGERWANLQMQEGMSYKALLDRAEELASNEDNKIKLRLAVSGQLINKGEKKDAYKIIKPYLKSEVPANDTWGELIRQLYILRKYQDVAAVSRGVEKRQNLEQWIVFNIGLSHIVSKNWEQAEIVFKMAESLPRGDYHPQVLTHLALVQAKLSQKSEAMKTLHRLGIGDGDQSNEAIIALTTFLLDKDKKFLEKAEKSLEYACFPRIIHLMLEDARDKDNKLFSRKFFKWFFISYFVIFFIRLMLKFFNS